MVLDMDRQPFRTVLEELVRQSRRTIEETCADFEQTARAMNERAALSSRQLARWMAGEINAPAARPVMRRVAERHWGRPFDQLLAPPAAEADPLVGQVTTPVGTYEIVLEEAAIMAAQESFHHVTSVGGAVPEESIEQVHIDVQRLARQYHAIAPIQLLAKARRVRNVAYQLLDQTGRPTQKIDLYLAAGQACALMATASFDIAVWEAAEDQARAAATYADLAGHHGLRSWAKGTQALIAYWTDQPNRARMLAQSAIGGAPRGAGRARLYGIEARAWAHLGNAAGVQRALGHADDAMAQADGADDLNDEIGGEFGWGLSLHSACTGTALLDVGDASGAADRIRTALAVLHDDPYSNLVPERAYIDLAAAELAAGRLDEAVDALGHVWTVPATHRRHSITGRLNGVVRALVTPRWNSERTAMDLRDRIEVYTTEATTQRALSA
jgi:hypothetical protein